MPDIDIRNSLLLDEMNPRFGQISGQNNILKFFSNDKKTQKLAKDIAMLGLSPMDRVVVMPKGKKFVVLEGNRRIAAVKLMNAPEAAAGDKQSAFFRKASKAGDKIPKFADCHIVNDRTEARPWISRKHNGQMGGIGTVDWDSLEQERFLALNGETGRYAHLLTLIDQVLKYDSDQLPSGSLAVIDRVLQSNAFLGAFSVTLETDGSIEKGTDEEVIVRFFETVFSDYESEKINTRKLNTDDQIETYVKDIVDKEFSGKVAKAPTRTKTTSPEKRGHRAKRSREAANPILSSFRETGTILTPTNALRR